MFNRANIYLTLWSTIARYALSEVLINRGTSSFFLIGKSIRFGMILLVLFLLKENTRGVAGYTSEQVIVFFLSYQFLDTLTQTLYRGVYTFSRKVRSGDLDFYLSKPINPLFRILTGEPDIIDAFFFVPTTLLSVWLMSQFIPSLSVYNFFLYLALLLNGFLIATAFHILVICLGVLTTEVDNAIMLYRDVTIFSRFPVTMYAEPLRTLLFLIVPVGVMNTIPVQVLLGKDPFLPLAVVFCMGVGFFVGSLLLWNWSIKRYTSAGG